MWPFDLLASIGGKELEFCFGGWEEGVPLGKPKCFCAPQAKAGFASAAVLDLPWKVPHCLPDHGRVWMPWKADLRLDRARARD